MPNAQTDKRLNLPDGGSNLLMQVTAGVVALRDAPRPDAQMTSQALHGEHVRLHHEDGEFGLVQSLRDNYVGWALMEALSAPALTTTHRVSVIRTYVYSEPNLKSAPHYMICGGAEVAATGERENKFVRCERAGWVFERHLQSLEEVASDPAAFAEAYLHSPYLWGGRESLGLDCTGLTQAAFGACGVLIPRDSDMQFAWAGEAIDDYLSPGKLQRSDLVFWRGHVGIMLDDETLLHANAYHMAVAREPLVEAITRIASYYGEPIGARRIDVSSTAGQRPDWMSA